MKIKFEEFSGSSMIHKKVYLKEISFKVLELTILKEEVIVRVKTQISYVKVGGIFCHNMYFRGTLGRRPLRFPSAPKRREENGVALTQYCV